MRVGVLWLGMRWDSCWVGRGGERVESLAVGSPAYRPHDSGELDAQHRRGRAKFSLSRKKTGSQVLYASSRTRICRLVFATCAGMRIR